MLRREIVAFAALTLFSSAAAAQETVKIGLILPMTGQQASTGKQIDAAVKLYQARNGTTVAGKKVEVFLKDDTGVPDVAKRLAQELVVNDKVAFLAGFGLTPIALAVAPIATQAKVPEVVMAAGTSSITEASPFVVRTSFTLAQSSVPMAEWAIKNGIKKVVTLVSDFGPGLDAEKSFTEKFKADGGTVVDSLRVPLRSPDFSPVLQKAVVNRVGQCILTCATADCYNGLPVVKEKSIRIGGNLRFFGDGFQISKKLEGCRFWRLPVMKLSTIRTDSPRTRSASARWDPMNPAPPVTR
jgi:branched-chain amino acid transport system substrate-binding protein